MKSFIMFKNYIYYYFFLFMLNFNNLSISCNSDSVRLIAKSLSDNTGIIVDFEEDDLTQFKIIQPGTKWCGAGNIAENYDDLGSERETDMCCRAHDNCPDIIEAGQTRRNLTNEAFYTRLSCECDEQFRICLRNVNRGTANNIGSVYFNGLATKCFRRDYPILKCVKRGGWLNRKCLKYTYDTRADRVYQWFDVNNYQM